MIVRDGLWLGQPSGMEEMAEVMVVQDFRLVLWG